MQKNIFFGQKVYILLKLAQNDEDRDQTQNLVWPILKKDPRLSTTSEKLNLAKDGSVDQSLRTFTEDSLLHMSASSGSTLRSNSFLDDDTLPPFPCPMVTSFFVLMSQGNFGAPNWEKSLNFKLCNILKAKPHLETGTKKHLFT